MRLSLLHQGKNHQEKKFLGFASKNGATPFSITTPSITIFSIMTLSIKRLFATRNINDTQHNNTLYRVPFYWVSHFIYCYAECSYAGCHYAVCRYAECRGALKNCKLSLTSQTFFCNCHQIQFLMLQNFFIRNEHSGKISWSVSTWQAFSL
jgi:hypothetical protein